MNWIIKINNETNLLKFMTKTNGRSEVWSVRSKNEWERERQEWIDCFDMHFVGFYSNEK
jgi:hypothetical protein